MTVFRDRDIFNNLCDEFIGSWVWIIHRTNKGRIQTEAFGKISSIKPVASEGVTDVDREFDFDPSHYDYYELMIVDPIDLTAEGAIPYSRVQIYRNEKNTDFAVLSTAETVTYQLTKQKVDLSRNSA